MLARLLVRLALLLAVIVLPVPSAVAQTATAEATGSAAIDYNAWEADATRAENLIEAGLASTAFLENLRADLVEWRARFLAAQNANRARITTIQGQIDALGPAPAEGATEPDAVASRRADLDARLSEAQLPGLTATEAFNRANGLISEIDAILGERQAQELLELAPTPLNPLNWQVTLTAFRDVARDVFADTSDRISREDVRDEARSQLGTVIILAAIGLLLIVRGRRWVANWAERLIAREGRAGRVALSYFVSLGQLVLPAFGIAMVMAALALTGMAGEELTQLIVAALILTLSIFYALWLGFRLFPSDPARPAALEADVKLRRPARWAIWWIGLFMGIASVAQIISDLDQVPPAVRGVLLLPVYIGLGYGYWRLARVLGAITKSVGEDGPTVAQRISRFIAGALPLIAVVGSGLAAVGYLNAAETLMIPTALTLSILGILLSLQPVIRDVYALVFRADDEAARAALTPILINFLLIFAALPVLALVWGVRPERLGEIYARFLEGFTLGDTRVTPLTILAVILVFVMCVLATRLLQGAMKSTVLPRTRLDVGARNAVTSGIGYVGIALAAIIAITSVGIDLTALGFVLGALSVGIGFGLQNVVSNFVSGIILLIERPISEGDWIEVNGNMGIVKDISVRSTRIETFDRTDVIVPNADFISGTVTNWTRGNSVGRAVLTVGVAYGTDTRRVQEILLEIARDHPLVATFPEPGVDFLGFGADSLDFRIRAILRDVNQMLSVKTEMNHKIAERFAEEGIEIPFAQRDVWLRNPESLPGASTPSATSEAPSEPEEGVSEQPAADGAEASDMPPAGEKAP